MPLLGERTKAKASHATVKYVSKLCSTITDVFDTEVFEDDHSTQFHAPRGGEGRADSSPRSDAVDSTSDSTRDTKSKTNLDNGLDPEALLASLPRPDSVPLTLPSPPPRGPESAQMLETGFWALLESALEGRPEALKRRDAELEPGWYLEPWYYAYPQYFGAPDVPNPNGEASKYGSFDDLRAMLPYLVELGFKNLFLLPHYASPQGDGGYDVSSFSPDPEKGGPEAWNKFLTAAAEAGVRVVTDAPWNHTSVNHPWFQAAASATPPSASHLYHNVTGREVLCEENNGGDVHVWYKDPDGIISPRQLIFPDVARTHMVTLPSGQQYYSGFYPFQVDLNLRSPIVLLGLLASLAEELNTGIMGKRLDAIAHWTKAPGRGSFAMATNHSISAFFKTFASALCSKFVILPEVVADTPAVAAYAGSPVTLCWDQSKEDADDTKAVPRASEGDAVFNFPFQGALREAMYTKDGSAWLEGLGRVPQLAGGTATWINLLEHHDETYMGFIRPQGVAGVVHAVESNGGTMYKNGLSAGCRYAAALGHKPHAEAAAVTLLYMSPGVPCVYYGLELGAGNAPLEFMDTRAAVQVAQLESAGVHTKTQEQCRDPREFQRGPIPRAHFESAASNNYPTLVTVRALNRLYTDYGEVFGSQAVFTVLDPVDGGPHNVLSCIRASRDTRVWFIVNLTDHDVTVRYTRPSICRHVFGLPPVTSHGSTWRVPVNQLEPVVVPVAWDPAVSSELADPATPKKSVGSPSSSRSSLSSEDGTGTMLFGATGSSLASLASVSSMVSRSPMGSFRDNGTSDSRGTIPDFVAAMRMNPSAFADGTVKVLDEPSPPGTAEKPPPVSPPGSTSTMKRERELRGLDEEELERMLNWLNDREKSESSALLSQYADAIEMLNSAVVDRCGLIWESKDDDPSAEPDPWNVVLTVPAHGHYAFVTKSGGLL